MLSNQHIIFIINTLTEGALLIFFPIVSKKLLKPAFIKYPFIVRDPPFEKSMIGPNLDHNLLGCGFVSSWYLSDELRHLWLWMFEMHMLLSLIIEFLIWIFFSPIVWRFQPLCNSTRISFFFLEKWWQPSNCSVKTIFSFRKKWFIWSRSVVKRYKKYFCSLICLKNLHLNRHENYQSESWWIIIISFTVKNNISLKLEI